MPCPVVQDKTISTVYCFGNGHRHSRQLRQRWRENNFVFMSCKIYVFYIFVLSFFLCLDFWDTFEAPVFIPQIHPAMCQTLRSSCSLVHSSFWVLAPTLFANCAWLVFLCVSSPQECLNTVLCCLTKALNSVWGKPCPVTAYAPGWCSRA